MKNSCFIVPALLGLFAISFVACSDDDDNDVPQSQVPAAVSKTFASMFPNAKKVEWESQSSFYVADFNLNTFDTEAWFYPSGSWAMTETDYGSLVSMLPMAVADAFNESRYSSWIVDDVTLYERPVDSFCIIEVETQGFPEISLIYDTFGNLINTVQNTDFDITPTTDPSAITF